MPELDVKVDPALMRSALARFPWLTATEAIEILHGAETTLTADRQTLTLSTGEVLAARKLVLATGQDGTGEWWMPDFVSKLPADRRAHTCQVDIDFERLRQRASTPLSTASGLAMSTWQSTN